MQEIFHLHFTFLYTSVSFFPFLKAFRRSYESIKKNFLYDSSVWLETERKHKAEMQESFISPLRSFIPQ